MLCYIMGILVYISKRVIESRQSSSIMMQQEKNNITRYRKEMSTRRHNAMQPIRFKTNRG